MEEEAATKLLLNEPGTEPAPLSAPIGIHAQDSSELEPSSQPPPAGPSSVQSGASSKGSSGSSAGASSDASSYNAVRSPVAPLQPLVPRDAGQPPPHFDLNPASSTNPAHLPARQSVGGGSCVIVSDEFSTPHPVQGTPAETEAYGPLLYDSWQCVTDTALRPSMAGNSVPVACEAARAGPELSFDASFLFAARSE